MNNNTKILNEVLVASTKVNILSLAGGFPANDRIPIQDINELFQKGITFDFFQYCNSSGIDNLKQWLTKYRSYENNRINKDQILITSGSQQAIDLISKIFIKDNSVIIESPTYLGALQAIQMYTNKIHSVDMDEEGINLDLINDEILKKSSLIYIQPSFHNPTGICLSTKRIKKLYTLLKKHKHILVIFDNAYNEIWFNEKYEQPFYYDYPQILNVGTFSKTISPGMRIGFIIGNEELIKILSQAKQANDIQSSSLSQYVLTNLLEDFDFNKHLKDNRFFYKNKCGRICYFLKKYIPKYCSFSIPHGGMFIWLTLPEYISDFSLLKRAIEIGIVFMPGVVFFNGKKNSNHIRLSFSNISEENLEKSVILLSRAIKNYEKNITY